jgi:hypothetical protein
MEERKQIEDWQLGNDSTLSPLTRVDYMNFWLKKNKQDILLNRIKEKPVAKDFQGFIDIDGHELKII